MGDKGSVYLPGRRHALTDMHRGTLTLTRVSLTGTHTHIQARVNMQAHVHT